MVERPEIQAVVVCRNVDCVSRGSDQTADYIEQRLQNTGSKVVVKRFDCFALCPLGPNALLYPQGTMYCLGREEGTSDTNTADLDEIIEHINGGERVERLTEQAKPFSEAIDLYIGMIDSGIVPGLPNKISS